MTGLVSCLLAAALSLGGVTGENLRARVFFDVNNAKVGDPLVLTIDFLGSADFAGLHPPALSRALDRRDWKLDAASAKTDTFRGGKRLTWRIRPRREGVLWFPALSFAYSDPTGGTRVVTANAVPVHARPGEDVVVEEMGRDETEMPQPDDLIVQTDELAALTPDERYAWRKACAKPTAEAFAPFDFPAGRLNEARCATLAGDWARALKIYSRLEWTTGQTPEIERGIVAALAVRSENPFVELPVWRQVGRPLLRYGWRGRVGWVAGSLAAIVLVFLLLGKLVRLLAAVGFVLLLVLPTGARAEDPFVSLDQMLQEKLRQLQQMSQSMGMGSSRFALGGKEEKLPQVVVRVRPDQPTPTVGENFNFIVELEAPKTVSIGQVSLEPLQPFGFQQIGQARNLPDLAATNPSNVVKRLLVPARYDVPMKATLSFRVFGMLTARRSRRGYHAFSFSFSQNFTAESEPCTIDVRPLPTANQPEDYAGIVATRLRFWEEIDLPNPETNDVICITYHLSWTGGYVPPDWMPAGADFELNRLGDSQFATISWRRFFVADGVSATPKVSFSWYLPAAKAYRKAEAGGKPLTYRR